MHLCITYRVLQSVRQAETTTMLVAVIVVVALVTFVVATCYLRCKLHIISSWQRWQTHRLKMAEIRQTCAGQLNLKRTRSATN